MENSIKSLLNDLHVDVPQTSADLWYQKYLAFQYIFDFTAANYLTKKQIMDNFQVLQEFSDFYLACDSVATCQQRQPGLALGLKWNNNKIYITKIPCVHGQDRAQIKQIKKSFTYFDFHEDYLLLDIADPNQIWVSSNRYHLLKQMAEWNYQPGAQGFLIWGPPGIGKTFILIAFINRLARKYPQQKIIFISAQNLIQKWRQANNFKANSNEMNFPQALKQTPILVIDDFGGEKWSSWVRDEVYYDLFNSRLVNQKLTFLTSNFSLAELKLMMQQASAHQEPATIAKTKAVRLLNRIVANNKIIHLTKFAPAK